MGTRIIRKRDSMATTHTPTVQLSTLLTSICSTLTYTLGSREREGWMGRERGEGMQGSRPEGREVRKETGRERGRVCVKSSLLDPVSVCE